MGSVGTKLIRDSCSEDPASSNLRGLNGVICENQAYNVRDLTSKVQHLTFLVAGGELPINSDRKLWKDIAGLSESLNKLRTFYPEELRIKSTSLLSLFEAVCSADQPSRRRKVSVSVQCDELFLNGLDHLDTVASDDSTRASSDSLVGDAAASSGGNKSASKTQDIVYICSECNGTIPVFNNEAFSLSLKLHYESAAHSQDSGLRNDKDDCRTTSPISSDGTSTTPSDVSITSGETTEDDCVHAPSETKTAINICIVKPSHAENSVRLTRCGTNVDATPRQISMWNSVRSRLVELGHVNYIVHHPRLKDFRCSLCKSNITGVQNIMQHVLGSTHTKLHLEERGSDKHLQEEDSGQMTSSSDDSSTNGKVADFEQDVCQSNNEVFQNKEGSSSDLQDIEPMPLSNQVMHITPTLNSDGSVNYEAWKAMAQDMRDRDLDACIQVFVCSTCGSQLTGIQKFIEHVHSYGHKDKYPSCKKPERGIAHENVINASNGGFSSSSSIEEISTPQFKCTPCNLTLTEKDVLAHLAGKKHALKESLVRSNSKEEVGRDTNYYNSRFEHSKLAPKVVNDKRSTLRVHNGKFHDENSSLALTNYVKGIEAIPKCDQAAQTKAISNAVNSSEKNLGVASKEYEQKRKLYSKKADFCRTGYNVYRYSSQPYSGMHPRKDKVLRSDMSCNYEVLKRPASYWCGVCNIMVSENQKYFHIHGDVELPCVPQQQVFGNAQYLIMNHSQSWGQ